MRLRVIGQAGGRRLALAVGAFVGTTLVATTSAAATPLAAGSVALDTSGTPILHCLEPSSLVPGLFGCGEGAPADVPAVVVLGADPSGNATLSLKAPRDLIVSFTFTIESSEGAGLVLAAPQTLVGPDLFPPFTLTGSLGTSFSGDAPFTNTAFGGKTKGVLRMTLHLPGTGLTIVASASPESTTGPTPTATASMTATLSPLTPSDLTSNPFLGWPPWVIPAALTLGLGAFVAIELTMLRRRVSFFAFLAHSAASKLGGVSGPDPSGEPTPGVSAAEPSTGPNEPPAPS